MFPGRGDRLKAITEHVAVHVDVGVAAAEVLGVADLVDGCFGKRHEPEVGVEFAVDDDPSVVESYGGFCVEPFEGDPGMRNS
jgi:hypothetical protein